MSTPPHSLSRAEARIDLAAIRHNVGLLAERAGPAAVLAVVKADAYGHGLVPVARAARQGGASWLGTALLEEALTLRAAGDLGRIVSWLSGPGERWGAAIEADVDVSASSTWALDEIAAAGRAAGRPARVHLKIDTGLGRAGAWPSEWPALCAAAARLQAEGVLRVVGIWSHFAYADSPGHPTIRRQLEVFAEGVRQAEAAGLRPEVRHIANSAATLTLPEARYDLVRPGLAIYGLSPLDPSATPAVGPRDGSVAGSSASGPHPFGLLPSMTLTARLMLTKDVPAGVGVSYGHAYTTSSDTTLGVVPLGYADGIPRHGSNRAPVLAAGRVRPIAGRVCMDQFVLDLGTDPAREGDEVVLFGDPARGEPSAADWARACETIPYEIVTRLGPRVPRRYVGAEIGRAETVGAGREERPR